MRLGEKVFSWRDLTGSVRAWSFESVDDLVEHLRRRERLHRGRLVSYESVVTKNMTAAAAVHRLSRLRMSDPVPVHFEIAGEEAVVEPSDVERRAAVERAPGWLAAHQRDDGSWAAAGEGHGRDELAVGQTGLAALALLGAGGHHGEGPFAAEMERALRWLCGRRVAAGKRRGLLGSPDSSAAYYGHAVATQALCVDLRRARGEVEPGAAAGAIDYLRAQNPHAAWRYGMADGGNDTCVTSWTVTASRPRWDVEGGAIDHHYWYWGTLLLSGVETPAAEAWRDALARGSSSTSIPTARGIPAGRGVTSAAASTRPR